MRIRCEKVNDINNSGYRRLFSIAHKVLISDKKVDFSLINPKYKYIVAFVDNNPVGIIMYEMFKNEKCVWLEMVYVKEKYRKLGVMRRMLKTILEDNDEIFLHSSVDAIDAYLKIGAKKEKNSLYSLVIRWGDFVDRVIKNKKIVK